MCVAKLAVGIDGTRDFHGTAPTSADDQMTVMATCAVCRFACSLMCRVLSLSPISQFSPQPLEVHFVGNGSKERI